jgi:hypothetical protein
MPTKLTLLAQKGRNKHGQRLVLVQCSCGSPAFECREDSFKQNRTTSCGFCRKGGRKHKPAPVLAPINAPVPVPEVVSVFEYGSPAWYEEQIAGKKAAALAAEKRCNDLEEELAAAVTTDLDTHKRWNAESTTARKLRAEIARLMTAKDKAETGEKKDTRTQAEITRDKIAALRGDK